MANKKASDLQAISDIDFQNDVYVIHDDSVGELKKATLGQVNASKAIFCPLSYGAIGDGVSDDVVAIQDAIDAAYASGGGSVYIPGGSYITTSTLYLSPDVRLELNPGAEIECTANVNVIQFMGNGAQVQGGSIRASNTSFDKAIFYCLDAAVQNGITANFSREATRAGAFNVRCWTNSEQHTGAVVRLEADTSTTGSGVNTAVQWTEWASITAHEFEYGVHLKCLEESGQVGFVNGNFFHDWTTEDLVKDIYLEGLGAGAAAISDNHFSRFASQIGSQNTHYIHMSTSGASGSPAMSRNTFYQMAMFDWTTATTSTTAVTLEDGAVNNIVEIAALNPDEWTSVSENNRVITRYNNNIPVISTLLHTSTYTAAEFGEGAILMDNTDGYIKVSDGAKFFRLNGFETTQIAEGDYDFTAAELVNNDRFYSPTSGSGSTPYDWTIPSDVVEGTSFVVQSRAASAPIHLYPPSGKFFCESDGTTYSADTPLKFTTRYGIARIEVTENSQCVIVWRCRASVVAAP